MALTPCQQAVLDLADAIAARHRLHTGFATSVTHGDKSWSNRAPDRLALDRYILDLQSAVDACNGTRRAGRAFRIIPSGW